MKIYEFVNKSFGAYGLNGIPLVPEDLLLIYEPQQNPIISASSGLSKVGNDIRLGDSNLIWTAGVGFNYGADWESNFTARTLVTKQYVDNILQNLELVIQGTENYIPKFDSPNGLTESLIFDNGTSVGIGTVDFTDPARLVVNGRLSLNSSNGSTYSGFNAGRQDIGLGANAGYGRGSLQFNINGFQNSAFGWLSGQVNNANDNCFFGRQAGWQKIGGSFNTIGGSVSLQAATQATNCTTWGYGSLFSHPNPIGQLAVGFQALLLDDLGSYNTIVGNSAFENLRGQITNRFNVGLGYNVSQAILSMENSIMIGSSSRPLANGQINQIVIGHAAIGFGSNTVTIGNSTIVRNHLFGVLTHADAILANESATLGQVQALVGSGYVHPAKTWVDKTSLTGATVISNLTINSLGHPTDWVTRTITPANIGAQVAGTYDNYVSWNLRTNGIQRIQVVKDGVLDIVAGANVTVSYSAGGVITISSSGGGGAGYTHPTYAIINQNLTGATVLASFVTDAIGSVTSITTRTLTLANLGYSGATDANNYVHPTYTLISQNLTGATVLSSFTTDALGSVTGFSTRTLTLANLNAQVAIAGTQTNGFIAGIVSGVPTWIAPTSTTLNLNDLGDVVITSPVIGHVVTWNGTNFVLSAPVGGGGGGGGTVTQIIAGTGLTGGTIITSGTIAVNFGIIAGTVAQGNDSRFHALVTLGANSNGLSLATQVLSLALVSTTVSGAMSFSDKVKLDGLNNYTHPTQTAIDSGALTGANVISRIVINTLGHATSILTRTLTLADLGAEAAFSKGNLVQSTGISITGTLTSRLFGAGNLTIENTDRGSNQNIFKNISNSAGVVQFSATENNDSIRFVGTGTSTVSFDVATKTITINSVNSGSGYTHPTYTIRNLTLSGAQVLGGFTSDGIGSVTGITTRDLTLGDLGYSGALNANNYVHPTKAWVDKTTLSGVAVISNLTINSLGHPTDWTIRNLTLGDLGYSGVLNADRYLAWNLAASGTAGTSSIGSASTVSFVAGLNITITRSGSTITISSPTYIHPAKTWADKVSLTGAAVISNFTIDSLGHPTNWSVRDLTFADLGYSGAANANFYTHPTYTARSVDTIGAQVIDIISSDVLGSITNITTRTLTLNDLGFNGATNADRYLAWSLAVAGTVGVSSIGSGGVVTFTAGSNIILSRSGNNVTITAVPVSSPETDTLQSVTTRGFTTTVPSLNIGQGTGASDVNFNLGQGRVANGNSFIDFHSASGGADFDFRIIKNIGAGGVAEIRNVSGEVHILTQTANDILLASGGAARLTIHGATGNVSIGSAADAGVRMYVNGSIRIDSDRFFSNGTHLGFADVSGDVAMPISTNNLLVSPSFANRNLVPANGIYSLGGIRSGGNLVIAGIARIQTMNYLLAVGEYMVTDSDGFLYRKTLLQSQSDFNAFIQKGVRTNLGDWNRPIGTVNKSTLWQDPPTWNTSFYAIRRIITAETSGSITSDNGNSKIFRIYWGISPTNNYNDDSYCEIAMQWGTWIGSADILIKGTLTISSTNEIKACLEATLFSGQLVINRQIAFATITGVNLQTTSFNLSFVGMMNVGGSHTYSQKHTTLTVI